MRSRVTVSKPFVFALCLGPLAWLAWRGYNQNLSANPIEFITHATGDWTLRFLVFTLMVTPARELLGLPWLIRYRRMIGLFAFFYGVLHFTTWIWLDKFFDPQEMAADLMKRRFILMGMIAFALMIPLALTSTAGWIRRLGGKRWSMLHRAVYLSAFAGVVHYFWLVKSDVRKPAVYAVVVWLLLGYRMVAAGRKKLARPAAARAAR